MHKNLDINECLVKAKTVQVDPDSEVGTHPVESTEGISQKYSTVISAQGYRAIWGTIKFYLRVRRLPED